MLSYDTVRQRPNQFLACTSLTVAEFDVLLCSFSLAWDEYRKKTYVNSGGGRPKLPRVVDKLFFILFYHKLYPIQEEMGAIFGMSQSQACTWIHILTPIMQRTLGVERCLPERNPRKLKEVLEACELHDFIIDGTERERQRPSDASEQKDFYSGKQKTHTYNNIVIVDKHERTVEYLSQTFEGTCHDKAICDEEQYTFPENSTLHKDKGFQGYEPENVITYQPKKKPRNGVLSIGDKLVNRVISRSRVAVEHVISGIKRCRIVKDIFRNTRIEFEDIVMEIACALHNFRQKHRSQSECVNMFDMI